MNESPNRRAVVVGLFVIIGLTFLLGGILLVGNLHETFNNKIGVFSLFDDVNGLQKGNNVWYSGVKIGTVSNLSFHGKSQVEVKIDIETKTRKYIRKDAKVKISSDGFIGNKILVIYGGTEKSPEVEEGDTLEVEKSFSSVEIINTLQDNNKNILVITNDLKTITKKLAGGEGTIGKLLNDSSVYTNINAATASLKIASAKAQLLLGSLETFSSNLNKEGTLANELTRDTLVFKSVKASVMQFQQLADTASVFISNLKQAGSNPNSPIGVMLHDEESTARLKETIKNLESSSKKLDEDLEAAQHNFLLRGFFKKKVKDAKSENKTN
ncbi:MAG TPA: MCE family protein [Lachnospiraceae bacterium]|jgi:phospholipid/cholesterol/gamma-HCH transport system substrate-binding protein|nr:MCE family protein [Lachnospiraceae bacterium]